MTMKNFAGISVCQVLLGLLRDHVLALADDDRLIVAKQLNVILGQAPNQPWIAEGDKPGRISPAEARFEYADGRVDSVSIHFNPKPGGGYFTVSFVSAFYAGGFAELAESESDEVKCFGSLDSAHKALRRIGIRPTRFSVETS